MSSSIHTIDNYEYDCTKRCKFHAHGDMINAAMTKIGISDEDLACYIGKVCHNFAQVSDSQGRNALHMAVSTNRYLISEWLINHGAAINAKDKESRSSALHRAIFYGCIDCVVLLLRYGADINVIDDDHLRPLQYICKMSEYTKSVPKSNELLIWGANVNYNLGGNKVGILQPQIIEIFYQKNISIQSVAISSYHSLFLDTKANLYAVGHGEGGRLGNGSENTLLAPTKISISALSSHDFQDHIIDISCSKNHSLLLTKKGRVFSCGINKDFQLGIPKIGEKLTHFREITAFREFGIQNIKQIIAKDCHSIAFNLDSLYVWGKNNGQFGASTKNSAYIVLPRALNIQSAKKIRFVHSSNTAIACQISMPNTTGAVIILYHDYKTDILKFPFMSHNITSMCLNSNETELCNNKSKNKNNKNNLELIIASNCGIYIWSENHRQVIQCITLPKLNVDKIFYKSDQILILSDDYLYHGNIKKISIKMDIKNTSKNSKSKIQPFSEYNNQNNHLNDFSTFSDSEKCLCQKSHVCTNKIYRIDLNNYLFVDRIINVFCDDELQSFAVIQENSKKYYKIQNVLNNINTFEKLYNNSSEDDNIHDVIFNIGYNKYYCHKYIIYVRSKGLMKIIIENLNIDKNDKNIYLNYDNLTSKMFTIILKHIYYDYYVTEQDLEEISISLGLHKDSSDSNTIFLKFVETFELNDLAIQIRDYIEHKTIKLENQCNKEDFINLQHDSYPELYDVTIKCSNDETIKAHKCVLVSRLNYFEIMLSHNKWSESNVITLKTIPYECMDIIIKFLYTTNIEIFRKNNYSISLLCQLIILSDQFIIDNLRCVCEVLLAEKISIKKCGEMLQFAHTYNCKILEKSSLNFICQNLQRILINNSLDYCEYDALKKINTHYRQIFNDVFKNRFITPDAKAINDTELKLYIQDFQIDLYYEMPKKSNNNTSNNSNNNSYNNNNNNNNNNNSNSNKKLEQHKKKYEKDAINSINKLLLVDDECNNVNINNLNKENSINNNNNNNNNNEKNDDLENWMKIQDKKDKRKSLTNSSISKSPKCNDILYDESKNYQQTNKNDFINLNDIIKPIEVENDKKNNGNKFNNKVEIRHNFSFGDLIPSKVGKISQKQRKFLLLTNSNEKKNKTLNDLQESKIKDDSPIKTKNNSNNNNEVETLTTFADVMKNLNKSDNEKSRLQKTSPNNNESFPLPNFFDTEYKNTNNNNKFEEKLEWLTASKKLNENCCTKQDKSKSSNNANTGVIPKTLFPALSSNSPKEMEKKQLKDNFLQVLEDEKREKEYREQQQYKSLVLTQIEETAIRELEQFYNIDNVFDENIKIQRKSMPMKWNYSSWKHK